MSDDRLRRTMNAHCEDCGTLLRGGHCGWCNEPETNDYIMSRPEWSDRA